MDDQTPRCPIEVLSAFFLRPKIDNLFKRDVRGSIWTDHVEGNLFPFIQPAVLGDVEKLAAKEGAAGKARQMAHKIPHIRLLPFLKTLPNGPSCSTSRIVIGSLLAKKDLTASCVRPHAKIWSSA